MRKFLWAIGFLILQFSCTPKKVDSLLNTPGSYLYTSQFLNGDVHVAVQLIGYKQHGLLREYYSNGHLKFTQNWEYGNRIGDTKFYDSTGQIRLHTETKYAIEQGVQSLGLYEHFRDTNYFPNNKDLYNQKSLENRTLVVPDVLAKLDSLVDITASVKANAIGRHLYTITIPNVPFTTISLSTKQGIVKSATQLECGYNRIDKLNGRCFELIPNEGVSTMEIDITAIINQKVVRFTPRRIELQ